MIDKDGTKEISDTEIFHKSFKEKVAVIHYPRIPSFSYWLENGNGP